MIDLHGLLPTMRHEVRRGGRLSLGAGATALAAIAITTQLDGTAALVPGGIALLGAVFAWFGPVAHLGMDRLNGHLEYDRTLPIALRVMATGRLLGASIRIWPLFPALLALMLGFRQQSASADLNSLPVLIVVPALGQFVATVVLWWLLALNSRWSFRKLWWIPSTIGFLPQLSLMLIPESWRDAIGDWFVSAMHAVMRTSQSPAALVVLLLVIIPSILAMFAGAAMLFASGLARYQFDPTQLGVPLTKSARVEMRSLGRGPVLAVARLRLRLATEQFRREILILLVLFLVAAFVPGAAGEFAKAYIPILAALLPAGIALQLLTGRMTGELEGVQQLPHPAHTIGLGYLLAIAVMAVPGAVALAVLRAMNGVPPTLVALSSSWGSYVAIAWMGAAFGLWMRRWHFVVLLVVLFGFVAVLLKSDSDDRILGNVIAIADTLRTRRNESFSLVPFAVQLAVIGICIPVFGRGLSRYRHVPT